jgi:TRAP-type C4-dicarboxylate transport system permease small subunit
VDSLLNVLKPRPRKRLLIIADFAFLAFCLYIIPPFIEVIKTQGNSMSVLLKIPMKAAYGIVPFGLGLTAIRTIQSIYRKLKEKPENLTLARKDSIMGDTTGTE